MKSKVLNKLSIKNITIFSLFFILWSSGIRTFAQIMIEEPDTIEVENIAHDIACETANSGTLEVDIKGGVINFEGDYFYIVNLVHIATGNNYGSHIKHNNSAGFHYTRVGLPEGHYELEIIDGNSSNSANYIFTYEFVLTHIRISSSFEPPTCPGLNDGQILISVSGVSPNVEFLWTRAGDPAWFRSTQDIIGLSDDLYTLTLTDNNRNCILTRTYNLAYKYILGVNYTYTDISCNGDQDGKITIIGAFTAPANQSAGYDYNWSFMGAPYPVGPFHPSIENLAAGTYILSVMDSNGCQIVESYFINEPNKITFNLTSDLENCAPYQRGITMNNLQGGVVTTPADYAFYWSAPQDVIVTPTQNQTGLQKGGTYFVAVSDLNYCTSTGSITINSQIEVTEDVGHLQCFGDQNGYIMLNVTGGSGNYNYLWSQYGNDDWTPQSDGAGNHNKDQMGLEAGHYEVKITDIIEEVNNDNCFIIRNFIVQSPIPFEIIGSVTHVLCNGDNTGGISVSIIGGMPPYSLSWSGGSGIIQNFEYISNLSAGIYTLSITDALGCNVIKTFEITEPDPIVFVGIDITDVNCYGDATGEIEITITGGGSNYFYYWTCTNPNAPIQNPELPKITNLFAGEYWLSVIYGNGRCIIHFGPFIVNQPTTPLDVTLLNTTNVTAHGGSNGTATIGITGGPTGSYTIEWYNSIYPTTPLPEYNSTFASGLTAGNYFVKVYDGTCEKTLWNIIISESGALLTFFISKLDVGPCNGSNNGFINLVVEGGMKPYQYIELYKDGVNLILPGASGYAYATYDGLSPGNYEARCKDANNIEIITEINIAEPPVLQLNTISITDVSCQGETNGSIVVSINGGLPNSSDEYMLTLSGPNGLNYINYVTAGNFTYNNLPPGNYSIRVVDDSNVNYCIVKSGSGIYDCYGDNQFNISDDCVKTLSITINVQSEIIIEHYIKHVSCFGGNDGIIGIYHLGLPGITEFRYSWEIFNDEINDWINYNYTSSTIQNLYSGRYRVTIKANFSDNEITFSKEFFVDQPDKLVLNLDVIDTQCDGYNKIEIISSTGGSGSYAYEWAGVGINPPNYSGHIQENLPGGDYYILLTDIDPTLAYNCSVTEKITLTTELSTSKSVVPETCSGASNGSIQLFVSGGVAPYTFFWTSTVGGFTQGEQNQFDLPSGTYEVTVTDARGCSKTLEIEVGIEYLLLIDQQISPVTCFGGNNGSIQLIVTGGVTNNYLFNWTFPDNSTYSTTNLHIDNLKAGMYNLELINFDLNGDPICITYILITVPQPASDYNVVETITNVACYGDATGSIELDVTGGVPPYSFLWTVDNGVIQNLDAQNIYLLSAGTYYVIIGYSDYTCQKTFGPFEINQPDTPIELTLINTTDVSVHGGSNGTATIGIAGGPTGSYTIEWYNSIDPTTPLPGYNSTFASDLPAGNYFVIVNDDSCVEILWNIIISEPEAPLTFNISKLDVGPCNGSNNGFINLVVDGGMMPYQYIELYKDGVTLILPGDSGDNYATYSALSPGNYEARCKDAYNIEITTEIDIIEPTPVSVNLTTELVSCDPYLRNIMSNPSGGTLDPDTNYTFTWITPSEYTPTYPHPQDLLNIPVGGKFTVLVTDINGCSIEDSIIVRSQLGFELQVEETDCGRYNVMIINQNGGSGDYLFKWFGPDADGFTGTELENLSGGLYIVEMFDANPELGQTICSVIQEVTLSSCIITLSGIIKRADMIPLSDGTVELHKSNQNGTAYNLIASISVNSDGTYLFENVEPGTYLIRVKPQNSNDGFHTWYQSVAHWKDATPIVVEESYVKNIDIILIPSVELEGNSVVNGYVSIETGGGEKIISNTKGDQPAIDISVLLQYYKNDTWELAAQTNTNEDGYFEFRNIPAGFYRIIIDMPGSDMNDIFTIEVGDDEEIEGIDFTITDEGIYSNESLKIEILTENLQNGTLGMEYWQILIAEGYTPIIWSLESDSNLPNGLTLSIDGVISGTPAIEDKFYFTVKATNSIGRSDTKDLSITIENSGIIETQHIASLQGYVQKGILYVNGLIPHEKWSVYNISGMLVYENIATDEKVEIVFPFSRGIYIVRSGGRMAKIVY